MRIEHLVARPVTSGGPHFFGYYDKCPWSSDGTRLLAMQAPFQDRPPTEQDPLTLGVVNVATGSFEPFAETTAWSWQQGTMLQWLPSGEVIYNDRRSGRLVAIIQNLATGKKRELPRPIYAVHPRGHEAICLDYHRLQAFRPGYGYPPAIAATPDEYAPDDIGLWRMDLESGENQLILSIAEAMAFEPHPDSRGAANWFNHATYNTDGSRFCFLHRFRYSDRGSGPWITRLFTLRSDGSEKYLLNGSGMTSHFAWRDSRHLMAWTWEAGADGHFKAGYWVMKDQTREATLVGDGTLTRDGHMTYSPDGRWLLTDEYPGKDGKQPLLLYDLKTQTRIEVGRFLSCLAGEIRCDLHPRWNHDGTQVCFDSSHEQVRQIYTMDVRPITEAAAVVESSRPRQAVGI